MKTPFIPDERSDGSENSRSPSPSVHNFRQSLSHFAFASESGNPPPLLSPGSASVDVENMSQKKPYTAGSLPSRSSPAKSGVPNTSTSPRKRPRKAEEQPSGSSPSKRLKRTYSSPEKYPHLNVLQDYLAMHLDVMFCGINPGCKSAETGHHFAHHSNHFWECLFRSKLTDKRLSPSEDWTLPGNYNLGLTNLVDRPSAEQAELSKKEMNESAPAFLRKVARWQPRLACFVGKAIWTAVEDTMKLSVRRSESSTPSRRPKSKTKGEKKPFEFGLQSYRMTHGQRSAVDSGGGASGVDETFFFVVPSSSARVVSHQLTDKVVLFESLRSTLLRLQEGSLDTSFMTAIAAPVVHEHPLSNTVK